MSQTGALLSIRDLVDAAEGPDVATRALRIAERLLLRSRQLQTPQERRQQAELDRMTSQPADKATLVEMTDQAFRTLTPSRVADQLTHILDLQGIPRFFSPLERTMLRGFQSFGEYLPGVAVPLVKDQMRRETANVILPAESDLLAEHLRQRQREGVRMNVNFLGEALLGEDEARRRLDRYLAALRMPDVECVSVKLTTIYSQVSPIAREHTVGIAADRLELLYRAALRETFQHKSGSKSSKFVYLDMEEYRDLHMTADAMRRALDREGLSQARAGIALQAYVPDSFQVMQQLIRWSRQRVASGGTPLTIRLVKGANMEMERVEASLRGWRQAPYATKQETDANFKKMLREMLSASHVEYLRVGVASHNLFDISLAMLWAREAGVLENVQFEMLEGMANHQRRAIFEASRSMLLYAPACRREEFLNAIGYLVRRLDENTGEQNFLRHCFQLKVGSDAWGRLADSFADSLAHIDTVETTPRRKQNRNHAPVAPPEPKHWAEYSLEPDTDWSLAHNAEWAETIVECWQAKSDTDATRVPLVVAGRTIDGDRDERESLDPSRPGVVTCRFREADSREIDQAIACASDDPTEWQHSPLKHRHELLRQAAQLMRKRRADLIGAAMADGGKTISEADPEVSEAIDFAEFYPLTARAHTERSGIEASPLGVVVVVSPWNFPLAIPCGGIAASLAAGNTVILKPASDTVLSAYMVCKCFWDAGVPHEVLQLIPCAGSKGGRQLINDPRVKCVILTGGTSTAQQMLADRPDLHLIAETGGKNATIVTALSDRDLAIKHVLHSAFSHGGQKCSATSLLLLEDEVYEDARFRETLADAVRSLRVGSVWDLSNRIGPLIRPPRGELARGMKELEPGESWLVMPERTSNNPQLFRPGIKWNVRPGSFTHRTELFGPVLGVMRYRRLEDAIGIVNATGYGLTSGLESLDAREQEVWRDNIRAGNLYINRPTTGAIVLRQPFGGVGSSAYGPGVKAGGPNYVLPLLKIKDSGTTRDQTGEGLASEAAVLQKVLDDCVSAGSFSEAAAADLCRIMIDQKQAIDDEFGCEHDSVQVLGQDNLRRYRPVRHLRIRVTANDAIEWLWIGVSAAVAAGCHLTVSHPSTGSETQLGILDRIADGLPGRIELLEETDEELAASIREGNVDRLRFLAPNRRTAVVNEACGDSFVSVIDDEVVKDGYVEVLRYMNEQSLSFDYHRYGNLGRRGATD